MAEGSIHHRSSRIFLFELFGGCCNSRNFRNCAWLQTMPEFEWLVMGLCSKVRLQRPASFQPWSFPIADHRFVPRGLTTILTMFLLVLNAGNGWEWGLLGLSLMIVDHSLIPYVKRTRKCFPSQGIFCQPPRFERSPIPGLLKAFHWENGTKSNIAGHHVRTEIS